MLIQKGFFDEWIQQRLFGSESAAAGAAISTKIYKVPKRQQLIILNANLYITKTTATATALYIIRDGMPATGVPYEYLILQTANGQIAWPPVSQPTANNDELAQHLLILEEDDEIWLNVPLTAAETIAAEWHIQALMRTKP